LDQALLQRAGDIKADLVRFVESEVLATERDAYLNDVLGQSLDRERQSVIMATDRFVLTGKDREGRSVIDRFLDSRPDLPAEDREMVKAWGNVVESLFEVDRHEGDAVIAVNLVNDLTYRVYSNRGQRFTSRIPDRGYIHARIVPLGEAWMLSGSTAVYNSGDRDLIYRLAFQVASASPQMVFQNPDKLARAWELQRRDREEFIHFFASDMVVLKRSEIAGKMRSYMHFKTYESKDSEGFTRAERSAQESRPVPPLPEPSSNEYPREAQTVGFVYDEVEGQLVFFNMGRVVAAFEDPTALADPVVMETVRNYLTDPELSPAPLIRLGAKHTEEAGLVVRTVLGLPDFDWNRDIDSLLRQYKSAYTEQTHLPTVIPISDRFTAPPRAPSSVVAAAGGRRVGRNEPCPCGSGTKYKLCCGP